MPLGTYASPGHCTLLQFGMGFCIVWLRVSHSVREAAWRGRQAWDRPPADEHTGSSATWPVVCDSCSAKGWGCAVESVIEGGMPCILEAIAPLPSSTHPSALS